MDEKAMYHVTLADGTEFDGVSDGAGNMIVPAGIDESVFTLENLKTVLVSVNGGEAEELHDQILRSCRSMGKAGTFVCFNSMTNYERMEAENAALREANEILEGAIAELAEIIGGAE